MKDVSITDSILYIGADDKTLDLFESQYVIPNGVSYNSYLILDEKVAVMDTVDARATDTWLDNLSKALNGRTVDYLVISHLEPDHSGNIQKLAEMYPDMKLIGNAKTFAFMPQFFDLDLTGRTITVKEGDSICLGSHTLNFFMAPMVHWPEVMVTYESSEKVLFSADGFGKFGALDAEEGWTCEARRYYFNIVGKYGAQVQALLKKAAALDIQMICPLHGPILKEDLGFYLGKYDVWSSYRPQDEGTLIAYASIHGNTRKAAEKMADILKAKGAKKVVLTDLSRCDMAEAVAQAFRYSKLVLASPTYNGDVFPFTKSFIEHLTERGFQNRTVALVENASWAPSAIRAMKAHFEKMANINIIDKTVTIKTRFTDAYAAELEELADEIMKLF